MELKPSGDIFWFLVDQEIMGINNSEKVIDDNIAGAKTLEELEDALLCFSQNTLTSTLS